MYIGYSDKNLNLAFPIKIYRESIALSSRYAVRPLYHIETSSCSYCARSLHDARLTCAMLYPRLLLMYVLYKTSFYRVESL